MLFFMLKVTQDNLLFLIDYSDDEGEDSPKENEEPEEWGKFLHLKERVSYVQHTILLFTQNLNLSSSCLRVLNRRRHPAIDRHLLWDL